MTNIAHRNSKSALKFVYSENNALSIIFQNNDILIGILGEFNNNLKELERITETKIYSRGNSILVKSEPEKNNLVKSSRGPAGGYSLTRSPEEIKLSSIIEAVDEKVKTVGCKKESKKGCTGKSIKCITHNLWDDLETHINSFFEKNTLKDIIYRVGKNQQKEINQ